MQNGNGRSDRRYRSAEAKVHLDPIRNEPRRARGCGVPLARGTDQQPGACDVAWAAEAAHRQGQFWSFHDAMFAAAEEGVDESTIVRVVRELGLDPVQFAAERGSASARARVAENAELGTRLQIPGTPAVFLNSRLVRPAPAEALEILIRQEFDRVGAESGRAAASVSGSNGAYSEEPSFATTVGH